MAGTDAGTDAAALASSRVMLETREDLSLSHVYGRWEKPKKTKKTNKKGRLGQAKKRKEKGGKKGKSVKKDGTAGLEAGGLRSHAAASDVPWQWGCCFESREPERDK